MRVSAWGAFVSMLRVAGEEQGFQVEDFDARGRGKNRAEQESEGVYHNRLLSQFACGTQLRIVLKFQADGILANDRAAQTFL
jgi:hypothetical protein